MIGTQNFSGRIFHVETCATKTAIFERENKQTKNLYTNAHQTFLGKIRSENGSSKKIVEIFTCSLSVFYKFLILCVSYKIYRFTIFWSFLMENLEKSVILSMGWNIFIRKRDDLLGHHLIKHLLKIILINNCIPYKKYFKNTNHINAAIEFLRSVRY